MSRNAMMQNLRLLLEKTTATRSGNIELLERTVGVCFYSRDTM
jgi:hypothetical protein